MFFLKTIGQSGEKHSTIDTYPVVSDCQSKSAVSVEKIIVWQKAMVICDDLKKPNKVNAKAASKVAFTAFDMVSGDLVAS